MLYTMTVGNAEPMARARPVWPVFGLLVATAGAYLLWYKRVVLGIAQDERMLYVCCCAVGFLVGGLILDVRQWWSKLPNSVYALVGTTGALVATGLVLTPLHTFALAASGVFGGAVFLSLIFASMRRLPHDWRARGFAAVFMAAGLVNTFTDMTDLPALYVGGLRPNIVMACAALAFALGATAVGRRLMDTRILLFPGGEDDPVEVDDAPAQRQVLVTGIVAAVCLILLFVSLGLRDSVAYPSAITGISSNQWMRFVEQPLFLLGGFLADKVGRRAALLTALVAAFIGTTGALAASAGAATVVGLATLCSYYSIIAFPTACVALVCDATLYSRRPALLGSLCFGPVLVGSLVEEFVYPVVGGASNESLFLFDLVNLVVVTGLTFLLVDLVRRDMAALSARVTPVEVDSAPRVDSPTRLADAYGFTARERDILALVMEGMTVRQMAAKLFVTEGTVKFHITNMLKKSGAQSRADMLATFTR
jgi:DNA-binding CsgD family transcriptional regulator